MLKKKEGLCGNGHFLASIRNECLSSLRLDTLEFHTMTTQVSINQNESLYVLLDFNQSSVVYELIMRPPTQSRILVRNPLGTHR